jgi:membrane-associated phospholipid phosphatase
MESTSATHALRVTTRNRRFVYSEKLRRKVVSALLLLVVWAAPEAHAGQGPVSSTSPARDDGRRTMGRFVANLFRGTVGVVSTDNIVPFVIGGAATGVGSIFDEDVADWIADPGHGFGNSLEDGAAPAAVGAVVAVLFATGRAVDAPRYRAMTYDWVQAFLINAGYTTLLKEVAHRERPNGEDDLSFPSGHDSNAFALAAVAERHYGWKAGVPAYTLASLVAVSRLQRNKHYLSDVMAGATLGYIVGRTVVRVNGQSVPAQGRAHLSFSPIVSRRTRGVVARVEF